ncbi:hypothetical protein [Catenovulum maritimum]|uniref:DUF4350 domain-containing protein n=1 Tax=Catenovulum maritimum TaxID=1513271 RepID=A0A0J8GW38_9ALTE|nr:hypothetical protein [Catenovulum maritimum]KMT66982.1 hypothetical protein XM47_02505 [Catenovulum maritimum]
MKAKNILLSALVLILLSVIIFIAMSIKWEKVEQEIGLSSEAASSPLLVASELVKLKGKTLTTLDSKYKLVENNQLQLPIQSSLILDEASLKEYESLDVRTLDWVTQGGHLIYVLSPRHEMLINALANFQQMTGVVPSLVDGNKRRNNILVTPTANLEIEYAKEKAKIYTPYQYQFEQCSGTKYSVKIPIKDEADEGTKPEQDSEKDSEQEQVNQDITLICEMQYGEGYITFIPSIDPISNMGIKHLDHGAYLYWLIGSNQDLYYLPSLVAPSWLYALWQWSWLFVVLTISSIAGLIWHLVVRDGRGITPIEDKQTPFSIHIEASGHFMFSNNHQAEVKQSLINDLNKKLEAKIPHFKYLELNKQIEALAKLTNLEPQIIEKLLTSEIPQDSAEKIKFIKLFRTLRKSL